MQIQNWPVQELVFTEIEKFRHIIQLMAEFYQHEILSNRMNKKDEKIRPVALINSVNKTYFNEKLFYFEGIAGIL